YDNSVIFIYGDHGSYTGITDALGNPYHLLPELTNKDVPLIVLSQINALKGVNSIPASHLDVYPTIANLLGIAPPKAIFGQDIFNTQIPLVVHRNILSGTINTIVTPTMAFVANPDGKF